MRTLLLIPVILLAACSNGPPPRPEPEPASDARQMHELGLEAASGGRYRLAIDSFRSAERHFLSVDDMRGVAVAAISQAELHLLFDERDAAGASLQRAERAVNLAPDNRLRDRVRLLAARILAKTDPGAAREHLLGLQVATPDIAQQAALLLCEADVHRGETRCVADLRADDALTRASVARLRGRAALVNGNRAAAREHLDRALNGYRALAFRPGIAAIHVMNAELALQSGDRNAARRHMERALYLRLWMHDRVHAAELLAQLAQMTGNEGRERYRQWRDALLDDSAEPDWNTMLEEVFVSR